MNQVQIKCSCGNSGWFEAGETTCTSCGKKYLIGVDLSVKEKNEKIFEFSKVTNLIKKIFEKGE